MYSLRDDELTPAFVCQNMYQLRNHVLSGKVCLTSCGNYTNSLASLVPRMICVNYRHRADMKTLMKLDVIKEELDKRKLHDIINNAVEPQINVHIQMPRCHSDWAHVVKEFNSPSNTIRLSESNMMRMKNITEKKSAFPSTLFSSLRIRPKRPISEEKTFRSSSNGGQKACGIHRGQSHRAAQRKHLEGEIVTFDLLFTLACACIKWTS